MLYGLNRGLSLKLKNQTAAWAFLAIAANDFRIDTVQQGQYQRRDEAL
jgi:hypothetical protein